MHRSGVAVLTPVRVTAKRHSLPLARDVSPRDVSLRKRRLALQLYPRRNFRNKGEKDYQMYRRQDTTLVKFAPEGGRGSLFLAGCRWSTTHRSHLVVLARPAVATRFPHRDRRAHVSARLLTARASSSGGVPVATIALVNDTAPSESSYRTEAHAEQCHRAAAF